MVDRTEMTSVQTRKKSRGRPSSFNKDKLLKQVMDLFWEHGYQNLSFNEIAQETGLTRASLYNAFESKEALFMASFQQYLEHSPDKLLREYVKGQAVGPVLYAVLKNAAKMYISDNSRRGCMGVNCLNELLAGNAELNSQISGFYEDHKKMLTRLIKQAVEQKELPAKTNPKETANMILIFMHGFSIFSKSKTSKNELYSIAKTFLENTGFTNLD